MELVSFNGVTRTKGTHARRSISRAAFKNQRQWRWVWVWSGLAPRTGTASLAFRWLERATRGERRGEPAGVRSASARAWPIPRPTTEGDRVRRQEREVGGKEKAGGTRPGSPLHVALGLGASGPGPAVHTGVRDTPGSRREATVREHGYSLPLPGCARAVRRRRGAVAGCALHLDPRHGPHVRNRRHAPPLAALQTPLSLSWVLAACYFSPLHPDKRPRPISVFRDGNET
jgi:hypothetical protein